jgi:uncharacterized protein
MSMSDWRARTWLLLGALISLAPLARAEAPNCEAATLAAEKTICSDPHLTDLDQRLGRLWQSYVNDFTDEGAVATLRREQTAWVARRNACKSDAACIERAYVERNNLLSGKQPLRPFAGLYESAYGEMAVYPAGDGSYLVSILTSEPSQGKWRCEVQGTASGLEKTLTISAGDRSFAAVSEHRNLRIEPTASTQAIELKYCGFNGSITYTYHYHP